MAGYTEFNQATEYKINTDRMLDREFFARFVAFYLNKTADYTPDLDSFLNSSMAQIKTLSWDELIKMKSDFKEAMKCAHSIFEKWVFRKADLYPERREPINKALLKVHSVNLAILNREQSEQVVERFSKIKNLIKQFS